MADTAQGFGAWWDDKQAKLATYFVEAGIKVQRAEYERGHLAYYSEVDLYRCTTCAALIEEDHREDHIGWHDGEKQ
jgi:hypothetical protein